MSQVFQRATRVPSPLFQIIQRDARIDVSEDLQITSGEFVRELSESPDTVDAVFEEIGRLNGDLDKLFAYDFILPPETFMEKREFTRAEVQNPFHSSRFSGLSCGSIGSKFNKLLDVPVRLETAGVSEVSPLVRYRQIGGWLFSSASMENGRDGLVKLLIDQIIGQGGDLHPRQRLAEIIVEKKRIAGIRVAGHEEMIGCKLVLTDLTPNEMSSMIKPSVWTKRFRALVDKSPSVRCGYALNLGVDREVVPAGLASTALLSLGDGLGSELLRIEQIPQKDKGKAALHISCVIPDGQEQMVETGELRDSILDRVRWLVPFLDNHLKVLHSPFDGFGPLDLTGTGEGSAPPVPHPEEVDRWLLHPPPVGGVLGVENLPHRTGIKGLIMSGNQVVSGLGIEGQFIAAWGAARIACKSDSRRERLLKSMKSRVEI
jgi:phytoene dehydrogenase-like protein